MFQEDCSDVSSTLKTLQDYVRWSATSFERAGCFYGHGTDNAVDEAERLCAYVLKLLPDELPRFLNARLTLTERGQIIELVRARAETKKPLPYLTGEAWLADLCFTVTEDVLIPRSPLVELIDDGFSPWYDGMPEKILEIGTGSGCLACVLAMTFPEASLDAVDISPKALAVAHQNVAAHGLENRIRLLQSDLFAALADDTYDIIVANPPYVPKQIDGQLPREYEYEPKLALYADDHGLALVKQILLDAPQYLKPDGILALEVGHSANQLSQDWPVSFTWVELARGGTGVLVATRAELMDFQREIRTT